MILRQAYIDIRLKQALMHNNLKETIMEIRDLTKEGLLDTSKPTLYEDKSKNLTNNMKNQESKKEENSKPKANDYFKTSTVR